jgi:hypothetical protein
MKYQLIEEYFETSLFQRTVQDYFDTVLGKIIAENTTLSAKGLFIIKGEVKRDYYDMPYHIHILNGLIPALFVYEKYLQQKGWTESTETELYLKIFILGFTFHDANKLLGTESTRERGDLEIAVADLDNHVNKWSVTDFLADFEKHKSTIYFLALATEDRTFVQAEDYLITVNNRDEIKKTQRELCHLADGLASIQNEQLESIEGLYKAVNRSLSKISKIIDLPISYLKVRPNPYTLLSQNLLQVARKQLYQSDKKVFFATREGFIFWGEDIIDSEFKKIEKAYLKGSAEDIKVLELTKITAQKCKFGFIGSAEFTPAILDEITTELDNKFLGLSPNGRGTITDFDGFVELTKKMIEVFEMPIDYEEKDKKLYLNFYKNEKLDDDERTFRTVYNLHKIQWLNPKENKDWNADLNNWLLKTDEFLTSFEFEYDDKSIEIKSASDIFNFIDERVKSKNALLKTYLNFAKTYEAIQESDDIEEYIEVLQQNIIDTFTPKDSEADNVKQELFDRYFEYKGNNNLRFLETYNPRVPIKKEMCAFTGGRGTIDYTAEVAFAMKARGFSNRTITALNNNTSHVSALFAEENKLRASLFKFSDANLVIYHDFFEAKLDVDREIIKAAVQAKNELKILKNGTVEFDKNGKFQYNLYNLDFIKLAPKVEPTFFLVRKCLRMVQLLGIRSYIAGIMTPYQPHKAVFHFENAPRFLKLLGWDSIRLTKVDEKQIALMQSKNELNKIPVSVDEALDEIRLVLTFGKNRIESNLLKIAKNRLAYFSIYYGLKDDDKRKVYSTLVNFYTKYKHKFSGMTITQELVELAVKIDTGFKSSAEETWLIRTAFDYLRTYHKQGYGREDIIQKTCGEIFRKKRMDNPSMEAIKDFATAIYDDLFLKDWSGKVLTVNQEKDWIYQFAFLFREKSLEIARVRKSKTLKRQLTEKGKEITEENVKELLPKEQKRYANQYFETIKNL